MADGNPDFNLHIHASLRRAARWMLRQIKRYAAPFLIGAAALFGLYVLRFGWSAVVNEWGEAEPYGAIIVGEPTVYTRERLVNDRFEQEHWLRRRLERTDELEHSGMFDSVQFITSSRDTASYRGSVTGNVGAATNRNPPAAASGSGQNAAPPNTDQTLAPPPIPQTKLGVSPLDRFRDLVAYRDDVRKELMQTQLDDRHDIAGNTLIRLDFDASVVPADRAADTALVVVTVKGADQGPDDDKFIYEEWRLYLQYLYDEALDNLLKAASDKNYELNRSQRQTLYEFNRFLRKSIRNELATTYGNAVDAVPMTPAIRESCTDTNDAVAGGTDVGSANLGGERSCKADTLYRYVMNQLAITKERARFEKFRNEFRSVNRARFGKASYDEQKYLFSLLPEQCKKQASADNAVEDFNKGVVGIYGMSYPCPEAPDEIRDTLGSEIILFNFFQIKPSRGRAKIDADTAQLIKQMLPALGLAQPPESEKKETDWLQQPMAYEFWIRRAAAFFMQHKAEIGRDQITYTELSKYYNPTVEDCGINRCRVVISSKPEGTQRENAIDSLIDALNRPGTGIRVFAYAVTPKELTEYHAARSETNTLIQALAQGHYGPVGTGSDIAALADYLKEINRTAEGLQHHPLVVGFGEGSGGDDRQATFGWVIHPPTTIGEGRDHANIAAQHTLSATISLPSWWRKMEVKVSHCWLPDARSGPFTRPDAADRDLIKRGELHEYCELKGQARPYIIALPWNVGEISRKLGIEVIPEPYVNQSSTFTNQSLEIGRPGQIVLEGGRLWRGTVVILGNYQQANEIQVTPNMQGIVAKFDCVLPPPDYQNRSPHADKTHQVAVVWTSEGRTDAVTVQLQPFRSYKIIDKNGKEDQSDYPCWDPRSKEQTKTTVSALPP